MNKAKIQKNKFWLAIVGVLLAIIIALSVLFGISTKGFTDFENFKPGKGQNGVGDSGFILPEEVEGSGISVVRKEIPVEKFAQYGISSDAESAFTLTASFTPADVTNKEVDWSVQFVDSASEWANGKTVTEYVRVTPTADGALTANVECLQAFGERVKIVVTSRAKNSLTADCICDYAKHIISLDYRISDNRKIRSGNEYESFSADGINQVGSYASITPIPLYSVGTVEDKFTYSFTAKYTAQYISAWQSANAEIAGTLVRDEFNPVVVKAGEVQSLRMGRFLGAFVSGDAELIGQVNAQAGDLYWQYVGILREVPQILSIKITATGSYSSYSCTTIFGYMPGDLPVAGSGLELYPNSFVF